MDREHSRSIHAVDAAQVR